MNALANIPSQCDHTLQQAISHHHAGRLHDAEQLYKTILHQNPIHAESNHNLGVLAMQVGQVDAALHHIELALLADRTKLQYALTYAKALLESGQNIAAAEFIHGSMLKEAQLPAAQILRQQLINLAKTNASKTNPHQQNHGISNLVMAARKTPSTKRSGKAQKEILKNGITESIFKQLQIKRVTAFKRVQAYSQLESLARSLIAQDANAGYAWTELAYTLLQQEKPSLAASQEAVRLNPDDAEANTCLAHSLVKQGHLQEAVRQFQRTLEYQPGNAEVHYHLGNLLSTLQRWQEAEHHYRRAVSIQADYAKAHCNLAKCLQLSHRLDEAKAHYQLALKSDPHLSSAHHNLGLILKAAGDFEPALVSLRAAVKAQFDMFRLQPRTIKTNFQVQRNKNPIDHAQAHRVLDLLQHQFKLLHIEFCLFAGCALGVFREGDLLPFDKDLDIAVHATVNREQLIQGLLEGGHFQLSTQYRSQEERAHQYSMTLVHTDSNISVDIFFLHPDGPEHFLAGAFHPGQPLLCRLNRFDFAPHHWRGQIWHLPSNTAHYLAQVYGENWRQPDRGFDTVLSNPARIPAAMPAVLCYAYSRLCLFLQERDWVNSQSICRQILARTPDALLSELQTWLLSIQNLPHPQHSQAAS